MVNKFFLSVTFTRCSERFLCFFVIFVTRIVLLMHTAFILHLCLIYTRDVLRARQMKALQEFSAILLLKCKAIKER